MTLELVYGRLAENMELPVLFNSASGTASGVPLCSWECSEGGRGSKGLPLLLCVVHAHTMLCNCGGSGRSGLWRVWEEWTVWTVEGLGGVDCGGSGRSGLCGLWRVWEEWAIKMGRTLISWGEPERVTH